ncbi:MAG: ABC transporter substrate-binding protein [Deltaproteobacteria bacterium]|nr:ABC transporter substrate-binding protein [Deltaproteobacteria bacterium]
MKRISLLPALALLLCAQVARAEDTIRIGIISTVFGYAPVFVAKEKGFFKREGLYPEIVVISRNENIVQALVSDSLQFGNVPPNLLLTMQQQGFGEIKLIAGSFNGTTYSLVALAKHKKIEDLKGGARLGMSGFTSAGTMMMKQLLKERGVIYPRDYSLISIGNGSAGLLQGLQAGQIDAALLAQPLSLIAIEQGLSNLLDAYKVLPEYQLSAIGVRDGWAQKNRPLVVRYLKALLSTYQWLHDNRDEAIKLLGPITKLERKYIPASWEVYTKTQIWPRNGAVSVKGVQTLLNLMAEDGVLKKPLPRVEDIMASSFLDEARKALGQ